MCTYTVFPLLLFAIIGLFTINLVGSTRFPLKTCIHYPTCALSFSEKARGPIFFLSIQTVL